MTETVVCSYTQIPTLKVKLYNAKKAFHVTREAFYYS